MPSAPLAEIHYKLVWNLTELGRMLGLPRSTIERYVCDADGNCGVPVGKPEDGPRWVRLVRPLISGRN